MNKRYSSNRQLLESILKIQSVSGHEEMMASFIINFARKFPSVSVSTSDVGNVFLVYKKAKVYPLLVAHTDTVHPIIVPGIVVEQTPLSKVTIETYPFKIKRSKGVWSSLTGIGGDDKCGIFILLSILRRLVEVDGPPCKFFFPVGEENGFIGTRSALSTSNSWFSDVGYMIEPDRRGSSDIINGKGSWTSDSFLSASRLLFKQFNFHVVPGGITDITHLSTDLRISAFNVSCGYYNPHKEDEYIVEKELFHTLRFVWQFINTITGSFLLPPLPPVPPQRYNNWSWPYYSDGYDYSSFNSSFNNSTPSSTPSHKRRTAWRNPLLNKKPYA